MKHIKLIVSLSFTISSYVACGPREPLNCRAARIFGKPKIEGVIDKKFIDKGNHSNRVVDIRQFKQDKYILLLDYGGPNEDFFDYVSVHDTIRKDSNSLTYHVIKPSGEMRSFFLHWNCPDTLSLPR